MLCVSYFVTRGTFAEAPVVSLVAAASTTNAFASVRTDFSVVSALQPVLYRKILVAVASISCKSFTRLYIRNKKNIFKKKELKIINSFIYTKHY